MYDMGEGNGKIREPGVESHGGCSFDRKSEEEITD